MSHHLIQCNYNLVCLRINGSISSSLNLFISTVLKLTQDSTIYHNILDETIKMEERQVVSVEILRSLLRIGDRVLEDLRIKI